MPFLRPDLDDLDGGWTDHAGGTNLAVAIDEIAASDADFIRSGTNPSQDIARVRLSDPSGSVDTAQPVTIRYRYAKNGSGVMNIAARLKQGTTVIAEWLHEAVLTSHVTAAQVLTPGEKAAISNWNDLFLEFEANPDTGLSMTYLGQVSPASFGVTTVFNPLTNTNPQPGEKLLILSLGFVNWGSVHEFSINGGSAQSALYNPAINSGGNTAYLFGKVDRPQSGDIEVSVTAVGGAPGYRELSRVFCGVWSVSGDFIATSTGIVGILAETGGPDVLASISGLSTVAGGAAVATNFAQQAWNSLLVTDQTTLTLDHRTRNATFDVAFHSGIDLGVSSPFDFSQTWRCTSTNSVSVALAAMTIEPAP